MGFQQLLKWGNQLRPIYVLRTVNGNIAVYMKSSGHDLVPCVILNDKKAEIYSNMKDSEFEPVHEIDRRLVRNENEGDRMQWWKCVDSIYPNNGT